VSWELRVELKRGEDNINVWLRQLGPNNSKGYGNTKYKIYANNYDSVVDIAELRAIIYFKNIFIFFKDLRTDLKIKKSWAGEVFL